MPNHRNVYISLATSMSKTGKFQLTPLVVLTLHHQITIYFDLCKTPWMVKLSMMMKLWNRTWFNFLPIKIRSSMSVESWSCQEDGKRSLNKIENISLIKVHSLYLKNVFNLYEKIGNYLWDNPITYSLTFWEIRHILYGKVRDWLNYFRFAIW